MPKIILPCRCAKALKKERLVTRQTGCESAVRFLHCFSRSRIVALLWVFLSVITPPTLWESPFKISSGCNASRSTLKLEEAILTFIPPNEENKRLNENMVGVDLGACPGGWTYQLVGNVVYLLAQLITAKWRRVCMIPAELNTARKMVKFQPPKRKHIDWLVCDMVEQQVELQFNWKWLINGWCRETIFNLKLPMKNAIRSDVVFENLAVMLAEKELEFDIQAKHLYHDREEITSTYCLKIGVKRGQKHEF